MRKWSIYVDKTKIAYEKECYIKAINKYRTYFDGEKIEMFSAPGRNEIGGNHTDHQRGEVLAHLFPCLQVDYRIDEKNVAKGSISCS